MLQRILGRAVPRIAFGALAMWTIGCGGAPPPPPNIVLIVIDTLRADHLGAYGYARPTSPQLDELAAQGALFEQANSVASYTRPSTASILTGQYPSVHGAITHADSIVPGVPTLAEKLNAAGYLTAGIYRNGNVSDTFGFARGFDSYRAPDNRFWKSLATEAEQQPLPVSLADDRLLTDMAVPFLRDVEATPFFLYLHLQGPHDPYAPPKDATSFLDQPLTPSAELFYQQRIKTERERPVLRRFIQGSLPLDEVTRQQIVDLYDGEIAFADQQIGTILEALDASGFRDDTWIIVTSDHGEEFWDHGSLAHGHSNFQELLHVPLIIDGPEVENRRIRQPVSLIDLTPTILDLAGLEVSEELPGRSLATVLRGRQQEPASLPIYAEGLLRIRGNGDPMLFRSLQMDTHKLILDFQRQRKMLFDLGADTGETQDLISSNSQTGRTLFKSLIDVHARNLDSPYLAEVETVDVPKEVEEQIRALGYLGQQSDSTATSSLFRAPLRLFDIDGHGLMGHEREGGRYLSMLDLSTSDFPKEQLLYGWGTRREGQKGRGLLRKAGVRLKREDHHRGWRLSGRWPQHKGESSSLRLSVQIEGAEPEIHTIESRRFEISGQLAPGPSYLRFDLECDDDAFTTPRQRNNEYAYCLTVDSIGLTD